jgi:predicted esterase
LIHRSGGQQHKLAPPAENGLTNVISKDTRSVFCFLGGEILMKNCLGFIILVGLLLSLSLTLPLAAQDIIDGGTLALGDEVTGRLERGERGRYTLDIENIDEPIDIILYSKGDSVLYVYNDQGRPITTVDSMGEYGNEVFTWETRTRPAQIEVGFYLNDTTGEYFLSILPTNQPISEDPRPGEQVKRWAEVEVGTRTVTVPYLLYVPEDYDESQSYPFILFMHGSREIGPRLDFLKRQVIPKLIEEGEDYPFIIASPQLQYFEEWVNLEKRLASLVAHLQSEFPIDPDRIYVTGLSMGGAGAWHFALAYPDLPAAVVPIAGYYIFGSYHIPKNICDLAQTPLWVFHGGQDEVVGLDLEQALVDAVTECGGDVKFTLYPDADHEQTFVQGYNDPALYEWLLEHHK